LGKLPLVKVLPIAVVLAFVASGCAASTESGQPPPQATVTITASALPAASPAVAATLPVHVLKTSWGIVPAPSLHYPATVTIRLPSDWDNKVAAYGVDGAVLLAPAGWTEGYAGIGADGNQSAMLHATSASAIQGQLVYEDDDMGVAVTSAAPYFPWVRDEYVKQGHGFGSPVAVEPGLVEHLTNDEFVQYRLTSGPQVGIGLQVAGAARMTLAPLDTAGSQFIRLEVALPPAADALAAVILDDFAHRFEGTGTPPAFHEPTSKDYQDLLMLAREVARSNKAFCTTVLTLATKHPHYRSAVLLAARCSSLASEVARWRASFPKADSSTRRLCVRAAVFARAMAALLRTPNTRVLKVLAKMVPPSGNWIFEGIVRALLPVYVNSQVAFDKAVDNWFLGGLVTLYPRWLASSTAL
jgi:hypothetical protein